MQLSWGEKRSDATVIRYWHPDFPQGDSLSSVSTNATGITVTAEIDGRRVEATVSAGTAETPGTVVLTALTTDGLTLTADFKIAIRNADVLANTARDVVEFALRRITGNGETPTADEMEDGLEVLNAMLMEWRIDGMDLGQGVLVAATTIDVPDEYLTAIKYNLRVLLHTQYNSEPSPFDIRMAERGRVLLSNKLLDLQPMGFLQTNTTGRIAAYDGSY